MSVALERGCGAVGTRTGAMSRCILTVYTSYKQYPTVRTRERPPVRVPWAIYENRLTSANLGLDPAGKARYIRATRSRNCNLRIRPTDPGVASLSDFESVGPDRPTRCAERGGGILGRNDCFLAVSGGFERFQAVLDRHSPTDRPRSEKG